MTTDHVFVGVITHYSSGKAGRSILPSTVIGKRPNPVYVTGQALVADTWAPAHTVANAISAANGYLKPNTNYALASVYCTSAAGVAIRFKHADWSTTPGGMVAQTTYQEKAMLDFAHHGLLPVFNSSYPLSIEIYSEGTETPVIQVGLYELTEDGQDGCEDFNLWEEDVTDGQGLTELDICALSTDVVRDGLGDSSLVGYFLTGTAPLRGQLGGTDVIFQPVNLEIPPHATLAGDDINEIISSRYPLTAGSKIYAYGSS